jgi:hypothetical protein
MAEKLQEIRAAEEKPRQTKPKNWKVGNRRAQQVHDTSSEESEVESEGVEDVLVEIRDCITVRM